MRGCARVSSRSVLCVLIVWIRGLSVGTGWEWSDWCFECGCIPMGMVLLFEGLAWGRGGWITATSIVYVDGKQASGVDAEVGGGVGSEGGDLVVHVVARGVEGCSHGITGDVGEDA